MLDFLFRTTSQRISLWLDSHECAKTNFTYNRLRAGDDVLSQAQCLISGEYSGWCQLKRGGLLARHGVKGELVFLIYESRGANKTTGGLPQGSRTGRISVDSRVPSPEQNTRSALLMMFKKLLLR